MKNFVAGEHYNVDKNGCWIWSKAVNKSGYAITAYKNKTRYAHRLSYESKKGKIPKGAVIDHKCGVRSCVNPEHLDAVTTVENTRRGKHCKLSEDQRELIRSSRGQTHKDLAEEFGVSRSYISRLRSGGHKSLTESQQLEAIVSFDFGSKYSVDASGCHLWQGAVNPEGYGRIWVGGKSRYVHRALWISKKGWIPSALQVDHICRARNCINIEHLRLVTNSVNSQNRVNNVLTKEQVRNIKKSCERQVDLAKQYGVSRQVIYRIKAGKSWVDV